MSAGHGGQVLLSQATRELVSGEGLVELGLHRLKDLTEPQLLYQLGDRDFPPLKTLYQSNLPLQPTPLVGREAELREVLGLMRESRLVTLTGAGGSGKTRLALQAAAELVDEFKDGVWWVSLAALRDPELVEPTIAQVVGATGGIAEHLRGRTALLLVDNFEHLLDAAGIVSGLLVASPGTRVIATSRERLGLEAEQEYAVPPLVDTEAVALFTAKARRLKPDFEPDQAVGEICRRVDGLPLAVELAAARAKVLTPAQILERLGKSLDLLTAGTRDAPERQRTLRATIQWSYGLLSVPEQEAFDRLAVFPGSFSVEAAEFVAGAELDILGALLDKSLLRRTEGDRFFFLDTIRAFGAERIRSDGRYDDARERHLAFFHRFVQEAAQELGEYRQATTLQRISADRENIRAALAAARDFGEFELVGEIVTGVGSDWIWSGGYEETQRWLQLALANVPAMRPDLEAEVLARLGDVEFAQGGWDACDAFQLRALAVDGAVPRVRSGSFVRLSQTSLLRGHLDTATAHAAEALSVAATAGYRRGEIIAESLLGDIALRRGDYRRARAVLATAADRLRVHGEDSSLALVLGNLAVAELREGQERLAVAHAREMFSILLRTRDALTIDHSLELLAALLVGRGKLDEASIVIASSEALRAEHGWALQPGVELELHVETIAALDAAREGRMDPCAEHQLPADEAIALGLAALN